MQRPCILDISHGSYSVRGTTGASIALSNVTGAGDVAGVAAATDVTP